MKNIWGKSLLKSFIYILSTIAVFFITGMAAGVVASQMGKNPAVAGGLVGGFGAILASILWMTYQIVAYTRAKQAQREIVDLKKLVEALLEQRHGQ